MISVELLAGFGDALKELRWHARMKQVEVCRATGMTAPQVSRYENGHEMPTIESLFRYLVAVGADLCDLQRVLETGKAPAGQAESPRPRVLPKARNLIREARDLADDELAAREAGEPARTVDQVVAEGDRRLSSNAALQEIVSGLVKLNLEGMERMEHRMKSMEEWMEDMRKDGLEPRRVSKRAAK